MACIELSVESKAELMQMITELVVAAAGDKQRGLELFAEKQESKGFAWLAGIVFNGIVKEVTPWHSGYNVEFAPAFTTEHRESGLAARLLPLETHHENDVDPFQFAFAPHQASPALPYGALARAVARLREFNGGGT